MNRDTATSDERAIVLSAGAVADLRDRLDAGWNPTRAGPGETIRRDYSRCDRCGGFRWTSWTCRGPADGCQHIAYHFHQEPCPDCSRRTTP